MTRLWTLLLVFAAGCASAPPAQNLVRVEPVAFKSLEVRLKPEIILAGGAVWVTCIVPEDIGHGVLRMALEGVFASEMPIGPITTRRLAERVPCGTWTASCTVATRQGTKRVEKNLESHGDCQ